MRIAYNRWSRRRRIKPRGAGKAGLFAECGRNLPSDAYEAVSTALASSKLPWLGGPSFHPEAFSPVVCALAAAAALRWHASSSVAELVKSRLPALAQSVPLDSLHSSLARYFEAFAADVPPPAALC